MAASVPCAASRKIRVVGARVDSTAQRATTFPPPRTACFAREASILRIGMDAGDSMPSTTGPSVEQVRTTTSLPSQRASKASLVRSAISEVSPPACSAASSKSARTSCWSTGRSGPSICAAASNTAILLSAVCKQPMRTVFIRALSLERLLAEARIASKHDRPRAVVHFELGEDTGDMVTHRLHAQVKLRGDLCIVTALRDQLDQLELARRERCKRRIGDRMRGQEAAQFVDPA